MFEELKEEIMQSARVGGICEEGYKRLRSCSNREGLIRYYLENPDWCITRGIPDMAILRREFADGAECGIMVDREFDGESLTGLQIYALHGCRGSISVGLNPERALIPILYIANGCRLRVEHLGRGTVPLYLFGDNDVEPVGGEFKIYRR